MSAPLLLIVCLSLGVGVARYANSSAELAKQLNWWSLNIALPAMVLEIVPHLKFEASLWFLPAALWLVFLGAWLIFHWLGTRLRWTHKRIGGLILTAGLSNSAFVGLPLIEALRGKQALSYAALADQLGSFLAVAIGGGIITMVYSGAKADHRLIARKILLFPPFIALLIAVGVNVSGAWPLAMDDMLARIGATLAPVALFAVGLQLRFNLAGDYIKPLLSGLAWKLGLAPLLIFALGSALGVRPMVGGIAVLQAAMAPMVTGAILADQHDLDPPLANMMVGVGIALSFITVPLWNLMW